MQTDYRFEEVARLPEPGDNVAIAVHRLEASSTIQHGSQVLRIDFTLLEGHRFAVQPVACGEALLSWGLPFGFALCDIPAGGYVINAGTLDALRMRSIDFKLPAAPNFADRIPVYNLDEAHFRSAVPLARNGQATFMGYERFGGRGAGTRNYIVLLAISSSANGFVRALEARLKETLQQTANLDGVAAVAHTEGALPEADGREQLLRTLAGFAVHPNVAAVLLVEHPADVLTGNDLYTWMSAHAFSIQDVPHALLTLGTDFESDLLRGTEQVRTWAAACSNQKRTQQPLSSLKLALQCGGSDAFSGISGNPLAAWVARTLIQQGGSALLAETPELVGAEAYLLQQVRDLDTARKFLAVQARYRERAAAYGVTVEDNPGGGNRYRGLYNITLKSIGAARKRHPDVPLDGVLEYAQPLTESGYYFMDSPGNDLESIAGQVAAGCNLILFVTGNGSVTNFPFVPAVKVVTTTGRYNLMPDEMDINAGRYLDGEPLDVLGEEAFRLICSTAEGWRTAGERAGHAQVQLWRAWPKLAGVNNRAEAVVAAGEMSVDLPNPKELISKNKMRIAINVIKGNNGYAHQQVGLILPASLCSAQAARLAAEKMTLKGIGEQAGISRFVALMHTEGCGSSANTDELLVRTLAGYVRSPLVRLAFVMEHGCERTLNDVLKRGFAAYGIDPDTLGWGSVQMDGGLQGALVQAEAWFRAQTAKLMLPERVTIGVEALRLGILLHGGVSNSLKWALNTLADATVRAGGMVVVVQQGSAEWLSSAARHIDFAEYPFGHGLYRMYTPTLQRTEMLAGLGATGVNVILAAGDGVSLPGHPLVPVLQVAERGTACVDLPLAGDVQCWPQQILEQIAAVLDGRYTPLTLRRGSVDFQLTRAERGISL